MVTAVCTGGEAPPASLALAWLDNCGSVVAADAGLQLLKTLGRRADLWIGDGDSVNAKELTPWYREALHLATAKDDSDTDAAVAKAVERGAREVWLLGGGGGRMDHWWSNLRLFGSQTALTRWLTAHEQAWSLEPGRSVEVPRGRVSVFPLGTGPWRARSFGLEWDLSGVDFSRWHSLSNVAAHGARVEALEGRFLVICPFDEGGSSR